MTRRRRALLGACPCRAGRGSRKPARQRRRELSRRGSETPPCRRLASASRCRGDRRQRVTRQASRARRKYASSCSHQCHGCPGAGAKRRPRRCRTLVPQSRRRRLRIPRRGDLGARRRGESRTRATHRCVPPEGAEQRRSSPSHRGARQAGHALASRTTCSSHARRRPAGIGRACCRGLHATRGRCVPLSAADRMSYASMLSRAGRSADAIRIYATVTDDPARAPLAAYQRARLMVQAGDGAAARAALRSVAEQYATSRDAAAPALLLLADLQVDDGDQAGALKSLQASHHAISDRVAGTTRTLPRRVGLQWVSPLSRRLPQRRSILLPRCTLVTRRRLPRDTGRLVPTHAREGRPMRTNGGMRSSRTHRSATTRCCRRSDCQFRDGSAPVPAPTPSLT